MKKMSKRTMVLLGLGVCITLGLVGVYFGFKGRNPPLEKLNVGIDYMEMSAHSMSQVVVAQASLKASPYLPLVDLVLENVLPKQKADKVKGTAAVNADIHATAKFLAEKESKSIEKTSFAFACDGKEYGSKLDGGTQIINGEKIDYGKEIKVSGKWIGKDKMMLDIKIAFNGPPERRWKFFGRYDQPKNELTVPVICKLGETVLLASQAKVTEQTSKQIAELSAKAKKSPTPELPTGAKASVDAKIENALKKSEDTLRIILLNVSRP